MGLISGKLFAGLMAGTLTVSAIGYTGTTHFENVKTTIAALEDKAELIHDQAFTTIRSANTTISLKNGEIDRLGTEVERLEQQLENANGEIEKAHLKLTEKDAAIETANSQMETLDTSSTASLNKVNNLAPLSPVVDSSEVKVVGQKLTIAEVSSQADRKIKLGNANGVDIEVDYNGEKINVPAGSVIYVPWKAAANNFVYDLPQTDGTTVKESKSVR